MASISGSISSILDELTGIVEPLASGRRKRARFAMVERGGEFECYRAGRHGFSLIAKGSLDSLGSAKLPRGFTSQPVEIRLDGGRILSKTLKLPAASRNYLDAVVRHQLDRTTPWAADRVVFDYAPAEDEPVTDDQIAVRLVATSRDVFDGAMDRFSAAGVKPLLVGTSEDPLDQPSAVNLLRSDRAERRARLRRRVAAALLAIVAIGASLSALTGWRLYSLNAEAASLTSELDAARAEIESANAGTARSEGRERILTHKRDATPAVVLLDRLSGLVPTGTYLTELAIDAAELRVAGLTGDAPALIELLEAADFLSGVRFGAPTTREPGATQDRFEIVAEVALPAAGATD